MGFSDLLSWLMEACCSRGCWRLCRGVVKAVLVVNAVGRVKLGVLFQLRVMSLVLVPELPADQGGSPYLITS